MEVGFNTQAYIVALLPEHKLDKRARVLNGLLNMYGLEFSFSDLTVPHISLYMLRINSQYLDEVAMELSGIAEQHDGIDLSFSGWRMRNRYFAAMYATSREVIDLQQDVVARLNPLRAETHPDSFIGINNASLVEKYNVGRYGWKSIGDAYDPHMTITRFLEEDLDISFSDFNENEFNGIFDRIAIFEMGDSGTTLSQVATFILKNSK